DALAADGFEAVAYPWLQSLAVLAKACAVLGTPEQCNELIDRLAPHHGVVPTFTMTTIEPVAHPLAVLSTRAGRHADAERYFDETDRIAARMEAPHWRARVDLERARMLLQRSGPGDADEARRRAAAARANAEELGMARVVQQARALTPE